MFIHLKGLKEEIDFYDRQNKRLEVEDLLQEVLKKKPKYKKQIKENTQRIEKLEWEITMLY